tara:strand:+ start:4556 stop:5509 length:954 start_codon:yes stop_codon:yes gene_type:complete
MAYNKRPNGNLFHNIKGSQSSQAPTQPGIGGVGEVESPAPYLPVVRGALGVLARTSAGQAIKQGGKRIIASGASRLKGILGKGKKSIPEYASKLPKPKSFLSKAINTAGNIGIGLSLGSFFGSDDSSSEPATTTSGGGDKKKPGGYVKPGGKATGNMKDYALNSQGRRDEYTARGWKQDDTTSVKGGNKVVSTLKPNPVVKVDSTPDAEPLTITPPASTATKPTAVQTQKAQNTMDRKNRSIDKKQGKIDDANALGNTKKATRKQRSLDNKKARLADKGKLDQKYMSDLSGAEKPKEESPVPYTSRIQASAQYNKHK